MEKNLLENEKVSIIIPVYKVEAYIRDCLDSVCAQTHKNLEIILIDDGSPDQSGQICDEYAGRDERIQVIHMENAGVSAARNTGIDLATGTCLIFVDSDDQIHPGLVEECLKAEDGFANILWDQNSDQEAWDSLRKEQEEPQTEFVAREHFMKLYYENYMNPPFNKLFRTQVIRECQIHFPEDKNLGEDLLFNLQYLQAAGGDYRILHAPYYFYRENREGSLSTVGRTDLLDIQKKLFASIKNFLDETGIWTEENAAIYYSMYWDRLYLTWKLVKKLDHSILKDSIWQEIWRECGKRGLCTWERRLKRWIIKIEKIRYGFR